LTAQLKKYGGDPVVVQTVRATVAATLAYVVALHLSSEPAPLTAPLTALLVVQVTLYATLKTGVRRVNSVVVGVMIAIGFSAMVVLAALTVGQFVRVDEFVNEVAISAMLVLGVTGLASQAWDRVLETLIGAGVGLAFNFLFAPPLWVETAGESLEELARRLRLLLLRLAEELESPPVFQRAVARLHEARALDQHVAAVDASLRQAEDSLRLNPRISEGLLSRLVLRTGLDTLEICVVVVRVLARSLTDLVKRYEADGAGGEEDSDLLFPREVVVALEELFTHLGAALVSFAVLVTSQVSKNADEAEHLLAAELTAAWAARENVAQLLLGRIRQRPQDWQLHGALLAEIDRILDELAPEHRARRLMEELDRASLTKRGRRHMITWVAGALRGIRS
jgi:hypothetical protein